MYKEYIPIFNLWADAESKLADPLHAMANAFDKNSSALKTLVRIFSTWGQSTCTKSIDSVTKCSGQLYNHIGVSISMRVIIQYAERQNFPLCSYIFLVFLKIGHPVLI